MANLPGIPPAEAVAALQKYHDALVARLEHVRVRWEAQRPLPYFVDAMFEHSVTVIQAEMGWVTQFISQLKGQAGE